MAHQSSKKAVSTYKGNLISCAIATITPHYNQIKTIFFNRDGVGRTGVYLGIEPFWGHIANDKEVNVYDRVLNMRSDRPNMVLSQVYRPFMYYSLLIYLIEIEYFIYFNLIYFV